MKKFIYTLVCLAILVAPFRVDAFEDWLKATWQKHDGVLTINADVVQTGDYNLIGDLTLESLTEKSVLFLGTGGLVSEDTTDFIYDDGLNTLTVTRTETLQIVTAKAGENIGQGKAVYILSATGDKPQVFLADNTLHDSSHDLGVATETKTTGQNIAIGVYGELINVDTSGFTAAGDRMHVASSGNMQSAVLTSGAHIHMGHVTKKDVTEGIMFIAPNDYVHDIRGVTDEPVKISTGDDASTQNIFFNNYSQANLGFMQGNGLFTWNGDQLFVGSGSGLAFGEIYTHANTTTTPATDILATDVWYRIVIFDTDGESNNVTADNANDNLTISTAGKYMTTISLSTLSAGAGKTLHFQSMTNTKEGGVADSEDAGSDFLTDSDNTYSDGDLVATTISDCGLVTDVIYTVCGLADNGAGTFQLDETLGCGGTCDACDSALNIVACATPGTPTGTIEVRTENLNIHAHRRMSGGGGDVGSVSMSGILDLSVNDELELWLHNETTTDEPVVEDITFSVMQIGG